MKFSQPVTIAYDLDPGSCQAAIAYRSMLEYFSHAVALVRLDSEEATRSFLGHPPRSALTLLICHGWRESDADAVINLELQRRVNRVEYEAVQLALTPPKLAEIVDHGSGIFVSTACWSGKAAFARVFLAAGYDAFIAPGKTSDMFSAFQFVPMLAGTLLHEERDSGAYPVTTRQAYERARHSDDFPDGAAGFLLFERKGE